MYFNLLDKDEITLANKRIFTGYLKACNYHHFVCSLYVNITDNLKRYSHYTTFTSMTNKLVTFKKFKRVVKPYLKRTRYS